MNIKLIGNKSQHIEYLDGETTHNWVNKDEIRKIIRWCKRDQAKTDSLYPDYWNEVIDKLQELVNNDQEL